MLHSLCVLFIQHRKFIQCGQKCSHHNSSGSFNAFKQLKSKTTHLDLSANTNVVRVSRFNLDIHKGITYWTQLISHPSVIVLIPTWCLHIYHYKTPWYHLYTLGMTYTLLIPWLAGYKISKLSFSTLTHWVYEGNGTHITLVNTKPQEWSDNRHTRLSTQFFWELTSFKWLIIKDNASRPECKRQCGMGI